MDSAYYPLPVITTGQVSCGSVGMWVCTSPKMVKFTLSKGLNVPIPGADIMPAVHCIADFLLYGCRYIKLICIFRHLTALNNVFICAISKAHAKRSVETSPLLYCYTPALHTVLLLFCRQRSSYTNMCLVTLF